MTASCQYVEQVRRELVCAPARREKFIQNLEPLVEDFSNEKPNASLSDYREAFGSPAELAQQYMSTLDDEEVQKYRQRGKWFRRVPLLIMGLLIVGLVFILYTHSQRALDAELTEEITLIVTEDMTIDEMKELMKEMGLAN